MSGITRVLTMVATLTGKNLTELLEMASAAPAVEENPPSLGSPVSANRITVGTLDAGQITTGPPIPCCQPEAPVVACCGCGAPVHTCERTVAVDGDYRCPAHPRGVQLRDGRWVCSAACWHTITGHPVLQLKE